MGRARTRNDANHKRPLNRHFARFPSSATWLFSGSYPEGRRFKSRPRYEQRALVRDLSDLGL